MFFDLISVVTEEPEFTEYIENVTVPAGRNVKLGCSVKNLGSYKVSSLSHIPITYTPTTDIQKYVFIIMPQFYYHFHFLLFDATSNLAT